MLDEPETAHDAVRAAAHSDRLLTAADIDVPSAAMSRMCRQGEVERVIPGVYVGAAHQQHALIEVAAWTLRHPLVVACLLTAAAFRDLTDAFPRGTWLFVPKGASPPRSRVTPLHVVQTAARFVETGRDRVNGIEKVMVHGVQVRVTGPDRTTLDLWRYPRRVSAEHATEALRRRVRAQDFQIAPFARLGRRLEIWDTLEPIVRGLMLR